jgi:hypothetical protein
MSSYLQWNIHNYLQRPLGPKEKKLVDLSKQPWKEGRSLSRNPDLYEKNDQLAPQSDRSFLGRQIVPRLDRTQHKIDSQIVVNSGWTKPSIQLGALLFLQEKGQLSLEGRRRIHKLLNTTSIQDKMASLTQKEKISHYPKAFESLLRWVQWWCPLKSFHKKEIPRIGVGYQDKGAQTLSHLRRTIIGEAREVFLGENMEYLKNYLYALGNFGSISLFPDLYQDLGGGYWKFPSFDERAKYLSSFVRKLLIQY